MQQAARLGAKLALGNPGQVVTLAWQCYQKLRNIYHAPPARGRELVTEVISSFPTCPIPEVARLGRTLKMEGRSPGLLQHLRRLQRTC